MARCCLRFCLLSRDCGTASASKPQAPCLKSLAASGTLRSSPTYSPPTPCRSSGSPGGPGTFSSPDLQLPLPFTVLTSLPPLSAPPPRKPGLNPAPCAALALRLAPLHPLRRPPLPAAFPPPPLPDPGAGRPRLSPSPAPLRLSTAPSTAAPLCAFGQVARSGVGCSARARPATRQVPDSSISPSVPETVQTRNLGMGRAMLLPRRGSFPPASGHEVSARGRGFGAGVHAGSSGEGARRSGRTRLLASLQTPSRAPRGARCRGAGLPRTHRPGIPGRMGARPRRPGGGRPGPTVTAERKPSSAGCAASPKVFGGGKCAGSGCVAGPQLLAGVLGAAGRPHLHSGRLETRRLRELRSRSPVQLVHQGQSATGRTGRLPPRAFLRTRPALAKPEWVGARKRARSFYP